MDKRKSQSQIVAVLGVALAAFGLTSYFHAKQQSINDEYQKRSAVLVTKRAELDNLPEKVNKSLLKNNPTQSAQQMRETNEVVEKGKSLFTQLYKINSNMTDEQWQDRRELMNRYATKEALIATGLDYSSQGINRLTDSKIDLKKVKVDTGITADNELDGIIQVSYIQDSNLQDDKEKLVTMYQFIYDLKTHKFTTLVPLGEVSSEQI